MKNSKSYAIYFFGIITYVIKIKKLSLVTICGYNEIRLHQKYIQHYGINMHILLLFLIYFLFLKL